MTARARKSDPISSHKASDKMNRGLLKINQELSIMIALLNKEYLTANEILKEIKLKKINNKISDNVIICRRMSHLVDSGLVEKKDTQKSVCSVCKERRVSWKISLKGKNFLKRFKKNNLGVTYVNF